MRSSYRNSLLTSDDGFIGINFGADYCAEHEWGISGIEMFYGINRAGVGVDRYQTTTCPEYLYWIEETVSFVPRGKRKPRELTIGGFISLSGNWEKPTMKQLPSYIEFSLETLFRYPDRKLHTAWGKDDFGVISQDPEYIVRLRDIYQALKENKACIWTGGGGVFQNAGLCIALTSKIPQSAKDLWYNTHTETIEMNKWFEATGIKQKLDAAGKRSFYLGPKLPKQEDGSYEIWLNPCEQKKYAAGYFTVAELELWAEDKGPVLEKRKNQEW